MSTYLFMYLFDCGLAITFLNCLRNRSRLRVTFVSARCIGTPAFWVPHGWSTWHLHYGIILTQQWCLRFIGWPKLLGSKQQSMLGTAYLWFHIYTPPKAGSWSTWLTQNIRRLPRVPTSGRTWTPVIPLSTPTGPKALSNTALPLSWSSVNGKHPNTSTISRNFHLLLDLALAIFIKPGVLPVSSSTNL